MSEHFERSSDAPRKSRFIDGWTLTIIASIIFSVGASLFLVDRLAHPRPAQYEVIVTLCTEEHVERLDRYDITDEEGNRYKVPERIMKASKAEPRSSVHLTLGDNRETVTRMKVVTEPDGPKPCSEQMTATTPTTNIDDTDNTGSSDKGGNRETFEATVCTAFEGSSPRWVRTTEGDFWVNDPANSLSHGDTVTLSLGEDGTYNFSNMVLGRVAPPDCGN